jgi:ribosomal protein L22
MSAADEEKDAQDEAKDAKAKDEAPTKAAAAKKPAAKKATAEKATAKERAAEAEKEAGGAKKPAGAKATTKEPAAKDSAAKEPAAQGPSSKGGAEKKAPAAKKEPAAKDSAASKESAKPEKKPARRAAGKGAAPKPRRRVVRAQARYVRTSARKARMVCGHLRGKSVEEARAILAFTPRDVARDWSKLLESAVANAESNHELLEDDLIVREAYADEGPTIKRFRPRAMGRATPIRKRTSHLTITLTPDA